MARGSTLESILRDVRLEARMSPNAAHNIQAREHQVALIQREQARLWEDFAWPHLRVRRFIPLAAGQRFYDVAGAVAENGSVPALDIPIDRIERIEVKSDGTWLPLSRVIGAEQYATYDSALDQRASPARRWDIAEEAVIEIWPVPDVDAATEQEGYLRITGIRALKPLVDDNDTADLDDYLISLYAAGALLAASGAKDAQLKLEAAQRHYQRVKADLSRNASFRLCGVGERAARRKPMIGHYRPAE